MRLHPSNVVHNVLKFARICHVKKNTLLASQHLIILCIYAYYVEIYPFLCIYINVTLNILEIDHVNNFSVLLHILKNGKGNICLGLTLLLLFQVNLFLNQQEKLLLYLF